MGWREISHFSPKECPLVERLFAARSIPYRKRVLHLGAHRLGGVHAYTFHVPEDRFDLAIAVLKEQIGIGAEPAEYSGICPACGCAIAASLRCPDCGLNLSGDYSDAAPSHPFLVFLKREGLL